MEGAGIALGFSPSTERSCWLACSTVTSLLKQVFVLCEHLLGCERWLHQMRSWPPSSRNWKNDQTHMTKRLLICSLLLNNYSSHRSRRKDEKSVFMSEKRPRVIGCSAGRKSTIEIREFPRWRTPRTYGAGSNRSATPRRSPKQCKWWLLPRCAKRSNMRWPDGLTLH